MGFGEPDVALSWSFNGAPVVESSLAAVYQQNTVRGGRVFRQSFLQLCSLTVSTAGTYTCIASNQRMITNATARVAG